MTDADKFSNRSRKNMVRSEAQAASGPCGVERPKIADRNQGVFIQDVCFTIQYVNHPGHNWHVDTIACNTGDGCGVMSPAISLAADVSHDDVSPGVADVVQPVRNIADSGAASEGPGLSWMSARDVASVIRPRVQRPARRQSLYLNGHLQVLHFSRFSIHAPM